MHLRMIFISFYAFEGVFMHDFCQFYVNIIVIILTITLLCVEEILNFSVEEILNFSVEEILNFSVEEILNFSVSVI